MTVSTFYPDAHVESNTVDGYVRSLSAHAGVWAVVQGASTATDAEDDLGLGSVRIRASATTDEYDRWFRSYYLFDTSSIPDGDTISAATLSFKSNIVEDHRTSSLSVGLCSPASDTALVAADWDAITFTKQAADMTFASINTDATTYNVFTFNATGRGNVNKTGISKFSILITIDMEDDDPGWISLKDDEVNIYNAEETVSGTGDARPRLQVTHAAAPFIPSILMIS
jgi:hypothetical protein